MPFDERPRDLSSPSSEASWGLVDPEEDVAFGDT